MVTLYISNRAFGDSQKLSAIYKHHQIFNLAFKMNKLKTKYKNLVQSKSESELLSTALFIVESNRKQKKFVFFRIFFLRFKKDKTEKLFC